MIELCSSNLSSPVKPWELSSVCAGKKSGDEKSPLFFPGKYPFAGALCPRSLFVVVFEAVSEIRAEAGRLLSLLRFRLGSKARSAAAVTAVVIPAAAVVSAFAAAVEALSAATFLEVI